MGTQSCRLVRRISVIEELGHLLCSRPLPGWRVGSASDRVWTPRLGTFRCTGAKYPLLCQSVLCLWASRGACSPGGGAPLPDLMSPASRHRGADSHLLHRQERVSQEALPMACPQVSGHLVVCLCLWRRRRRGAGGGSPLRPTEQLIDIYLFWQEGFFQK